MSGIGETHLTTPEVSAERATVSLRVTVDNDSKQGASAEVMTEIFRFDADGKKNRRGGGWHRAGEHPDFSGCQRRHGGRCH